MAEGISKTMFIGGLVVAILASSLLSTAVSMNYACGPKGDKGDTGPQGFQGIQGPIGPSVNFSIANMSGWLPAPAYDSGWVSLLAGDTNFTHNLNTTELFVHIIGKDLTTNPYFIGSIHQSGINPSYGEFSAPYWWIIDPNIICINRPVQGGPWDLIRVMLWKIA